ncbi:DEPDC5 [Mytilus coruscus]|uniref:DEPDC5 n=1 Tax=Mytilus coruscus TaxID=42192 RepID=A0A6J8CPH1_MYTCO|nr:DEPDC5 [Mytilus coruscus]
MENEKIKKLHVHKRNPQDAFLGNDILINPKDFPDVVLRDILEIHHSDSDNSRLLLQVTTVTDEFQQKDTISIEHSIANSFHLKPYNNVVVKKVDPKAVALDLVELLFKDQYFSRSDFWRLRDSLSNTCAYLNKKLEAYDMRAQVYELWSKGERVTCGVINSDTRVVFRSSTSVVQIFIQMSSEMWDFDLYGDLYIEKAVDGFLTDLFAKWKDQNCLHDVSIVLFSRTFYEAQNIEEFPVFMRDCLQVDYMGRFYEDFYRIIIQNERYEDWTTTIKKLRKCINQYQDYVLKYHERPGEKIPKAYNSTAAQGNFLETLNMTLNLFEKYYFDRNFDRTGKVAVVITPGPGVFEVDRQLTNITKQRTIDCGVGSDLVCMGEQPLHAAPLFKFHSKSQKSDLEVGDDYNIPHWMNHSFYISKHQIEARLQGSFVPRIKPPPEIFKPKPKSKERTELIHSPQSVHNDEDNFPYLSELIHSPQSVHNDEDNFPYLSELIHSPQSSVHNHEVNFPYLSELIHSPQSVHNDEDNFPFVDYDEYDAQIFKVPVPSFGLGERKRVIRYQNNKSTISTLAEAKRLRQPRDRHISDDFAGLALEKSEGRSQGTRSPAINIPRSPSGEEVAYSVGCYPVIDKKLSFESTDSEETIKLRPRVGSAGSPVSHSRAQHHVKSRRALINPFAPSRMQFKMTSYRRRWVHAFPRGIRGAAVQTHHIHYYRCYRMYSPLTKFTDLRGAYKTHHIHTSTTDAIECIHFLTFIYRFWSGADAIECTFDLLFTDLPIQTHHIQIYMELQYKPITYTTDARMYSPLTDASTECIAIEYLRGAAVQTHHIHTSTTDAIEDAFIYRMYTSTTDAIELQTHHIHTSTTDAIECTDPSHHIHTSTTDAIEEEHCLPTPEVLQGAHLALEARKTKLFSRQSSNDFVDGPGNEGRDSGGSSLGLSPLHSSYQGNNDPHWPSSTGSSVFMQDLGLVSGRSKSAKDKSYLWGPTGEQEWSPEMTTGTDWRPAESHRNIQSESCLIKPLLGTDFQSKNFCAGISVDWKSLTMPASLPITTDYFPGKQSLTNDYVVSDYNLLPEDVNFDMNQSDSDKINPKKPLSTVQVFRELISSRLAQGFQIIVLPASTSPVSQSKLVPGQQYSMGLMRARPRQEPSEEYHLSIGRIFHKIRRVGSTITVTRYRPRHEQPALSYSYRYRFKVPDSLGYDVSWSEFKNEKLENYNWNYFDQYICTHGEGDFGLLESLKFWRSRFLLLPINIPATKKIIDGNDRCDIYQEISDTDTENFVHGFIRYLETLNKLKRTSQERRLKNSGDQVQSPAPPQGETTKQSDTQQTRQKETITASTQSTNIAEIMIDNQFGLPLLSKQPGLPHNCFIAEEAVNWCVQEVDGIKTITAAILLMQRLIDDQVIVHASGNPKHKFIYGFYLYCVIPNKEKAPEFLVYNSTFENEWCEVVVSSANRKEPKDKFHLGDGGPSRPYDNIIDPENDDWRTQTGLSFRSQGWGQQSATLTHKYVSVDVDFNGRSDRPEWATARYHAYYSPHCAWELELQWVVATGSILAELVSTWYRKARPCGFQFLPVPVDPFALPTAPDSDPLRGPIFLPLNIACMSNGGKGIFHGYDQDIKAQKLKHFQQSIIKRYGFMPFSVMAKPSGYPPSPNPSSSSSSPSQNEEQYVHCSGGMFVLIEDSQTTSPTMKEAPFVYGHKKKSASQLRKDYIARQTSRTNQHDDQHWNKIGFLWSWNYMLSKKWRTSHTGDEHFQDKMLADFREFCSNKDDRLKEYWHDYKLDNPV